MVVNGNCGCNNTINHWGQQRRLTIGQIAEDPCRTPRNGLLSTFCQFKHKGNQGGIPLHGFGCCNNWNLSGASQCNLYLTNRCHVFSTKIEIAAKK